MTNALVIQEKARLSVENFQLEVLSYLGQLTAGIHYFKVNIEADNDSSNSDDSSGTNNENNKSPKFGLLRIGSSEGRLQQELEVRELLNGYKMIGELLAKTVEDSVKIELRSTPEPQSLESEKPELSIEVLAEALAESLTEAPIDNDELNSFANLAERVSHKVAEGNEELGNVGEDDQDEPNTQSEDLAVEDLATQVIEAEDASSETSGELEYLEEEEYPEKEMDEDGTDRKLLLLTYFPEDKITLETWLREDNSLESSLAITSQVCQFFRYIHQRGWCFVQILPQFIEVGTPLKFFDLTGVYLLKEELRSGLVENYCAPELAYRNHPIQEAMSSYTVGALLYHAIHQKPLAADSQININIDPIPRIFQLLKISLSPSPEERFSLAQFLNLLVETRKSLQTNKIVWNVAIRSTIGLSTSRLQNEDSYGIRKLELNNSPNLILGVVADGMGGMAQGEVASKLVVETALEEPIPAELKTIEQQSAWLVSLVQKANELVTTKVRDGGTTLSIVLAVGQDLTIAHVGDSRIYLLRRGELRQLSEDHSLVAMLVASGQITQEESLDHPDRNVLTKSIGSKRRLSDGYVQQLSRSGQDLSLSLENGDILLLCSDGVWDLVSNVEITELFTNQQTLQAAVDEVINLVLQRGASDNATLLALEFSCHQDKPY